MKHYFLAGNAWLLAALIMHLGAQIMRYDPVRVAFFGVGKWFEADYYNILNGLCVALAALCFSAYFITARARRP